MNHLKSLQLQDKVNFIVGENVSDKSELIELITMNLGINLEGRSKNTSLSHLDLESHRQNYIMLSRTIKRILDSFFFRTEAMFSLYFNFSKPNTVIYEFGDFWPAKKSYKENKAYSRTKAFIESPGEMLSSLWSHHEK